MKHIIILFLLPIVVLFGSCAGEPAIKKEVFDKIDLGMTRTEVKYILGEPFGIRYSVDSFETYSYRVQHSKGDIRNAVVQFDKKGYVSFFSSGLAS
ncbi:MAG: outer membrane protein assembly factor BamE [Chitinophagaceae bacterium]|nr:outer membrane protein assembly factor BamE [Chitinophagaceae bacterium]